MAPPPDEVVQWLKETYPKPSVDPEWLEGCYSWIQDELHLHPTRDLPAILENVNTQLLESDFSDSMVPGTGIPQNALGAVHAVIKGPILVEVVEIMDIGHSAYSLLQVYESRVEYRKQAELRDANGDAEQPKPMPKYPRSMLQLQLSDGVSILPAIESKSLPQFELGETPLGFKMIIKNVTVRRGTAFLEPQCVELKGHRTADRDERRDAIFHRALKRRLGEEAPEEEAHAEAGAQPEPDNLPAPPAPATPPPRARDGQRRSPNPSARSPLRGIPLPLEPKAGPSNALALNPDEHADDADGPRRRKLPSRANRSPSPDPPPRQQPLSRSRYFSTPDDASPTSSTATSTDPKVTLRGPGTESAMKEFARSIGLSPSRAPPIEVPESDEEEKAALRFPAPLPRADSATSASKEGPRQKGKHKDAEFVELGSDYFESEFEMNDHFFEAIARAEEEALMKNAGTSTGTTTRGTSQTHSETQTRGQIQQPQKQTQTQTHIKAEPASQATSATLYSSAATTAGASRKASSTPAPGSRATSTPVAGPSSSKVAVGNGGLDVITISDDEDIEKENVPIPTRHVRRRIARRADDDVIELSD